MRITNTRGESRNIDTITTTTDLAAVLHEYRRAKAAAEAAKAHQDEAAALLLEYLQQTSQKTAEADGHKVSLVKGYASMPNGAVDLKYLEIAHPEVYADSLRKEKPGRKDSVRVV